MGGGGSRADGLQLVARPLIDDDAIFAYLHNRYQVCSTSRMGMVDDKY